MRYVILVALLLSLASSTPAGGAEGNAVPMYLVKATLLEVPPAKSKQPTIVLTEPQVMLVANREANVNVGGHVTLGQGKIPNGNLFRVNVQQIDNKSVRVFGMLEVARANTQQDDIVLRESFAIHFDKSISLGSKTRIRVSKSSDGDRWFELLVDDATNLNTSNVTATGSIVRAVPQTSNSASPSSPK